MLDNIFIAVGRLSILIDLKDFPHLLAFRPHHGHAILLLEASVGCPNMTWWDLKSSGGARPLCIPMPECPPATYAYWQLR